MAFKNNKTSPKESELGKLPPQAPELEKSILSCILNESDTFDIVIRILRPECFYVKQYELIYKAICELSQEEKPFDVLSVVNQCKRNESIEEIGGQYALTMIYSSFTSSTSVEYHSYIVLDMFIKREMIQLFTENVSLLYKDSTDILDVYTAVYDRLEDMFSGFDEKMVHHIDSTIDRALNEIESYASGKQSSYVKCGDRLFDNVVYTSPGQIISIAASRSAGKTRYLIKLIRGFCMNNNPEDVAFCWWSMEDPDTKIIRAFASTATGLDDSQMQSKGYKLSPQQKEAITKEMRAFSKYDIDIINEQDSMSSISRRFSRFVKKRPDKICFLVIDNIMLVEDLYNNTGQNQTSIEDKVAGTIRKIMNKTSNGGHRVVIIFLHHMTKEMESKLNAEEAYRPKLSHMKGSSRFADICSAIVLLNKPSMHKDLIKKHSVLPDIQCVNSDGSKIYVKRELLLQNLMLAEVAKNRDGEMADDNVAVARYIVDFKTMKFNELITSK